MRHDPWVACCDPVVPYLSHCHSIMDTVEMSKRIDRLNEARDSYEAAFHGSSGAERLRTVQEYQTALDAVGVLSSFVAL